MRVFIVFCAIISFLGAEDDIPNLKDAVFVSTVFIENTHLQNGKMYFPSFSMDEAGKLKYTFIQARQKLTGDHYKGVDSSVISPKPCAVTIHLTTLEQGETHACSAVVIMKTVGSAPLSLGPFVYLKPNHQNSIEFHREIFKNLGDHTGNEWAKFNVVPVGDDK